VNFHIVTISGCGEDPCGWASMHAVDTAVACSWYRSDSFPEKMYTVTRKCTHMSRCNLIGGVEHIHKSSRQGGGRSVNAHNHITIVNKYLFSLCRCLDPAAVFPKWREAALLGISHAGWASTKNPPGESRAGPGLVGGIYPLPTSTHPFQSCQVWGPNSSAPGSNTVTLSDLS
jgi:hypothetical protein